MNVLLLGSGGREHALAWKLSRSPLISGLFIAPGNSGTAEVGTNADIRLDDFDAIREFVLENQIKLVVVGPEDPLVNGITDYFEVNEDLADVKIIGPGREGAQLEGSKDFAKRFMQLHGIPTARYKTFLKGQVKEAVDFLKELAPPYVLKADGLAAGKGVTIHLTLEEAEKELEELLNGEKLGSAADKVVIEEFLHGIELSVFVLTDGSSYVILPSAKDYKRIGEGDTGPNTGGMGAISPVPFASEDFLTRVKQQVIVPTIEGLKKDGIKYRGFLFIGLMNVSGNPNVIEYNVRMGDPETEAIMPRLKNDLLELFIKTAEGKLDGTIIETDTRTAATVVAVSAGYPGDYEKHKEIQIPELDGETRVFHAGAYEKNGKLYTNGGRVLMVTSLGEGIEDATAKAYQSLSQIYFDGIYYRKDIGKDLLKETTTT